MFALLKLKLWLLSISKISRSRDRDNGFRLR